MDLNYNEKLSILSMLFQLALSDKKIEDVEIEFYIRIAKRLNISKKDYEDVFKGKITKIDIPETEYKRVVIFHKLLIMMYIDKTIDDKEIRYCRELGLKLALSPLAIMDILTKLKDKPQIAIDPYKVTDIFKSYNN